MGSDPGYMNPPPVDPTGMDVHLAVNQYATDLIRVHGLPMPVSDPSSLTGKTVVTALASQDVALVVCAPAGPGASPTAVFTAVKEVWYEESVFVFAPVMTETAYERPPRHWRWRANKWVAYFRALARAGWPAAGEAVTAMSRWIDARYAAETAAKERAEYESLRAKFEKES